MIDAERWLRAGGLAVLALIVFAETGLLVGFFLPGDNVQRDESFTVVSDKVDVETDG